MTEELKPCPFCGYKLPYEEGLCGCVDEMDEDEIDYPYLISCSSCGCGGPPANDEVSAVKLWNNRSEGE